MRWLRYLTPFLLAAVAVVVCALYAVLRPDNTFSAREVRSLLAKDLFLIPAVLFIAERLLLRYIPDRRVVLITEGAVLVGWYLLIGV